jgi:hypothetical protein
VVIVNHEELVAALRDKLYECASDRFNVTRSINCPKEFADSNLVLAAR